MALDADDEILQDFLVEASEILEQLNEQLVDLEQSPDAELLNAVFRGFHTIKGGAGFLNLTALVDVCHRAEDVFNLLRNGEKQISSRLMDTMLQVLDVLNAQFVNLRNLEDPEPADPTLLEALERLKLPDDGLDDEMEDELAAVLTEPEPAAIPAAVATEPPAAPDQPAAAAVSSVPAAASGERPAPAALSDEGDNPFGAQLDRDLAVAEGEADSDITDEEFEALLDALDTNGAAESASPPAASAPSAAPAKAKSAPAVSDDEITEEEFEALLDELHGKGQFHTEQLPDGAPAPAAATAPPPSPPRDDEDITEEEFEALLDELHGKGKFGAASGGEAAASPPTTPPPPATPPVSAPAPAPAAPAAAAPSSPAAAAKPAAGGGGALANSGERPPAKKPDAAAPQGETTVRVDTKRLDDIMNMVGELVLVRNRLYTLANVDDSQLAREEMAKAVANLDVVTGDLQMAVMKTRMQPIKKVFGRFPRVVRDLARNLKKQVNLVMLGEETDLDKNLVEALADPLIHLVRNAVDHGIELPQEREANGKPRIGTVKLAAEQEGDHILLTIEDDGAGMDPDKLRKIAVKKGVMDEEAAARLDDRDAFLLIFAAGFSTKEQISDISGRGVGMDVVKTRIAQLNGSIEINSVLGKGTRLSIKVPLTLAIMPTLMVKLKGQTFALPLVSVNEIFHLDLTRTNVVDGQMVVMIRDRALPLYYLSRWLVQEAMGEHIPTEGHVVVVQSGTMQVGFVVDQLIGQEEVVIKPLGALLHGTDGMAGATITGDGKIALILDVPSLMKAYA